MALLANSVEMRDAESIGYRVLSAARKASARAIRHAAAAATRIKPNALTVAGLGCIDTGAFTANHIVGWIVTGLSILALDWKLDDQ